MPACCAASATASASGVRLTVRFSVRAVVHVVELGDARVAGAQHLAEAPLARFPDRGGVEALGQSVHPLPPGPEVVFEVVRVPALYLSAQPPLEGVAVRVDETRRDRPSREALAVARGPDTDHAPALDGDAHAAAGASSVEEQVGYEGTPHPSSIGICMPSLRAASRAAS